MTLVPSSLSAASKPFMDVSVLAPPSFRSGCAFVVAGKVQALFSRCHYSAWACLSPPLVELVGLLLPACQAACHACICVLHFSISMQLVHACHHVSKLVADIGHSPGVEVQSNG